VLTSSWTGVPNKVAGECIFSIIRLLLFYLFRVQL